MVKRPYMAALSGYARPQDIEAAKQAGFDRHIAKPVTLDDIKQILLGAVRQ
jgi:CheY-like chemotaxis protein